jgi:hypothetical protein
MNVIDAWKLADHHKLLNAPGTKEEAKVTIKKFFWNAVSSICYLYLCIYLALPPSCLLAEISLGPTNTPSTQEISDLTTADNKENLNTPIRTLKDNNGLLYHQVQYPIGVSKKEK